jgi:IclR family pca regulon transcriptional regulator
MKPTRTHDTLYVGSLAKGIKLLRAFTEERPEMGLTELSHASGLDRSAVQRLANTLHIEGLLTRNPQTRRYKPSIQLQELAYVYLWSDSVVQLAVPKLIELGRDLCQGISLARPDGTDIVYAYRIPARYASFAGCVAGRRLPALNTSGGRVILAHTPEHNIRDCIANWPVEALTAKSTTDRMALLESVLQAAEDGYCITQHEVALNEIGVAAPILANNGMPLGAVHCSLSATSWTLDKVRDTIVPRVVETAKSILPPAGL